MIRFLTSYPMRCIEHCHFIDRFSGKSVGIYEDRHGVRWLAESRWSLSRVRSITYFQEATNADR